MLQFVPGNGGQDIAGAGRARGASGRHFAARMHQPAVSHRSEHRWEREFVSEHERLEVAIGYGNSTARTESHVAEGTTILGQGELCFRAAVEIVEHRLGEMALRQAA